MRLGIPVAVLVAVGGSLFTCGVNTGSHRVPAAGAISQEDALRFRLSTFPADTAAVFARRYLQTCLTHPAASDLAAARARLALLTQMATGGTDTGCGYTDTASSAATAPRSIEFTGQFRTAQGYESGAAAFLTFQVAYGDDRLVNAVLPIWVNDRANPTTMRIVGSLGFMPVTTLGAPPAFTETRTKDPTLASRLSSSVLQPFLTAWGASDTQQLGLVLTTDATATAKTGLRGLFTDPTVGTVTVFTARSAEGSADIRYSNGDEVIAQTSVQWTNTTATVTKQSAVYQIRLRQVQGKWAVLDITGSAIDPTGGPVQTQANPSTTTGKPSTAPTTTTGTIPAPTLPAPGN
ncbi:hypothetical protein [Nocardia sp. NPDC052566]|uniref:hypothetical protein n=1 Tax=Nocardia sp. NPDC052566 TaxID=3364330 RepID=UPI0037C77A71